MSDCQHGIHNNQPMPVAARYKAWVYSRSPAETAGSNPARGMDFCCECCVLAGTGLCGELITRPEESYQQWRIVVCDLETSRMSRPWQKKKIKLIGQDMRMQS